MSAAITFTDFHTVLSVLPVGFGLAAFARHGAIDPYTRLGRWYIGTMLAASVSGLGFIATLGFTPGQVLGLFTLALVAVGILRKPGYGQTLVLSGSYFMLMVFATTETLKHFPVSHPFATSANDPALLPVRLVLLALFVAGVGYQFLKIRTERRSVARLERLIEEVHRAEMRHAA